MAPNGGHTPANGHSKPAVASAEGSVDQTARLAGELGRQRLRTEVAIELSPMIFDELADRMDPIMAVIDDLLDSWVECDPSGQHRPELFGPRGFVATYVVDVQRNRDGRPHWQFCRFDGNHRPVEDETYRTRVWSYHSERLAHNRGRRPAAVGSAALGDTLIRQVGRIGELMRELDTERLRTKVAIELSPMVFSHLDGVRDRVAAVVDDVVTAWRTHSAGAVEGGQELTGPRGFIGEYAGRVLYDEEDPDGEMRRMEFLAPEELIEGASIDVAKYDRRVWTHHAAELVGQRC